jgi:serine/threonine-protein kinase RsbW
MSESKSPTTLKPATVEVRVPSRLGFEKVVMSTAASVAKLMGFREERIEDLKTAVAEACINAIEHGNRLNEKLSVGVVLTTGADALEVKVMDEGKGMNRQPGKLDKLDKLKKPDLDRKMRGEEVPRGMGMFLIQALVDEAEWVAGDGANSSYVRLVIRLDKDAE